LPEAVDGRWRDRRPAAVERLDRGEVLRPRLLQSHQRVVGGDRPDRVGDAVFGGRVERDLGPEASGEDERGVLDEPEGRVDDRAGDVEQRSDRQDDVAGTTPTKSAKLRATAATLAWEFIAPLGGPVVPEVYVRSARSSGEIVTGSGLRPAFSLMTVIRSP